ncbi:ArnT family glycosyltransferase [Thermococcus camini]|nr:glycosyltransferase family 39 protein [Thermococcus camini]
MITIDRYYPPLATLIPIPIYAITGPDPRVGIFIENAVFIVILVYALYKLSEFTGSRVPSIIAVFAVLTSPLILDQAITFMLDIPLTAMAVLTWYLLLKSNGFRSRRYSVLSGISLGAGLLAKWTFPIFVMVPVFYELNLSISPLTLGIRGILKQRKNELKNLLTLSVLAVLVAGWWYIPNFKALLSALKYNSQVSGALEGDPPILTLQSFIYYPSSSINYYFGLLGTIVLIGMFIVVLKLRKDDFESLLIIQIITGFLIFTLTRNKAPRFLMPMIPFMGLVIGIGIHKIFKRKKYAAIAVTIVLMVSGIVNVLTFQGVISQRTLIEDPNMIPVSGGRIFATGFYESRIFGHVEWAEYLKTDERDWNIKEILADINDTSDDPVTLYILAQNPWISWPLRYRSLMEDKHIDVIEPTNERNIIPLLSADYVLYTEGGFLSEPWALDYVKRARAIFKKYNNITREFYPVSRYKFPDGAIGVLYARRNSTPLPEEKSDSDNCENISAVFGNSIELTRFCIYNLSEISRSTVLITYTWKSLKKVKKDYIIFVHFTPKGSIDAKFQQDHGPCGGKCPTSSWQPGDTVTESYVVQIPSGCYTIRLGFWDPASGERLEVDEIHNDGYNRAIVSTVCNDESHAIITNGTQKRR